MIIPTADFDPMFADDGIDFRTKMIEYIRKNFADLLGPHLGLLKSEKGLEILSTMYASEKRDFTRCKAS